MKLLKKDLKQIIIGSSILGTGGGGNFDLGLKTVDAIKKSVDLVSLKTIPNDETVITVFGVGGLKQYGNAKKVILKNVRILEHLIKTKIKYLIPVEIGPSSLANTFSVASQIDCRVVDGDIVGYRASPEVFLETISLRNISRCPLVASSTNGTTITINDASTPEKIEIILRQLSIQTDSKVYVAGYPMPVGKIKKIVGIGSVSFSLKTGAIASDATNSRAFVNGLRQLGFVYYGGGLIIKQQINDGFPGFTSGKLIISDKKDEYILYYKNEFLLLEKNGLTILTCPDSIILVDEIKKNGINNGGNNMNKRVLIFGKKSIPIWRSRKGRLLFSPKNIGYQFPQVLL